MLFIPTALAKESYHSTTNDRVLLAQVWGKNMTIAEYMEKVDPGSLNTIPKDVADRLKVEPMVWPNKKGIQSGEKVSNATKRLKSNVLNNKVNVCDIIGSGVYQVFSTSQTTTKVQNQIGYLSYSQTIAPTRSTTIPSMFICNCLYEDSWGNPISASQDLEVNSNYAASDGYASIDYGTHNYWVEGQHTLVWPINCIPSYTEATTVSPIIKLRR